MKISQEFPPNYEIIKFNFPNLEEHKPLFCWQDTIYNPFKVEITKDIEIHEEAHSKRQGNEPNYWWQKYLTDPQFRLEEEIIAYGTQYAFIKQLDMKRSIKDWKLEKMAQALSSDLYGNMIQYGQAESKIRNYISQV